MIASKCPCRTLGQVLSASLAKSEMNDFGYFASCRTTWISVRRKAHGEMYMPKSFYRIRGPSKPNRHIVPLFRNIRGRTIVKMDLPNIDSYLMGKMQEENFEEFIRTRLRLQGLDPTRTTIRQTRYFIASSNLIIDPYKPPENDGSFSDLVSSPDLGVKGAVKSKATDALTATKNTAFRRWTTALNKIKQADGEFDVKTFGERALNIYVQAHAALQNRDQERLHELVTEHAYPTVWNELKHKTLRWEYISSLEPPKVVHLRHGGDGDETIFGQATVRFHSQQKLAIYDQFGRLYYGDENASRNVLEYVVFENFLSNEYGLWRMHGKIASKKSDPAPSIVRTYKKSVEDDEKNAAKKKLEYKYAAKFDEKSVDGLESDLSTVQKSSSSSS